MPAISIDGRRVEVEEGRTILDAARALGIPIPTMCFREGWAPTTSCMVCVVRVKGHHALLPSCAFKVYDGMEVESETPEIREARRTALELLLSDHQGDCIAPCQGACPAHMNIPLMIRQIAAGQWREAIATVQRDIALPSSVSRLCPGPCEKACRRGAIDQAVSICLLQRLAADLDRAEETPYVPPCAPATGQRVAIVGTGPAGLSAAYHLCRQGIQPVLFDERGEAGGMLRIRLAESGFPLATLDAEIAAIARLGAEFRLNTRIGRDISMADVIKGHEALILASGEWQNAEALRDGLDVTSHGVAVHPRTGATNVRGVFACGDIVRKTELAIHAVGVGKTTALAVAEYLLTGAAQSATRPWSCHIGRIRDDEREAWLQGVSREARRVPAGGEAAGFTVEEAQREARRCLHCDCRRADNCRLRECSALCGANPARHKAAHRRFELDLHHPEIVYEPGKCILCGLCLQAAERAGERVGLTFVGRSYSVRVRVPFEHDLGEALQTAGKDCVAVCPTGALAFRDSRS